MEHTILSYRFTFSSVLVLELLRFVLLFNWIFISDLRPIRVSSHRRHRDMISGDDAILASFPGQQKPDECMHCHD